MKKLTRIISTILVMIIIGNVVTAYAGEKKIKNDHNFMISAGDAYEYSIAIGSDEWMSCDTAVERIDKLRIPEGIIENLSTDALLLTVLRNPYLADIWAYDSLQIGYDLTEIYIDGLSELLVRSDARDSIKAFYSDKDAHQYALLMISDDLIENEMILESKVLLLDKLAALINEKENEPERYIMDHVYTPNGSAVSVYKNLTYYDHGTTLSEVSANQTALLANYSSATIIRNVSTATAAYNCHSYAWYSTSSTNNVWMNDPSVYMSDGSYSAGYAQVGSKVYWYSSSYGPIHSGILYSTSTSSSNPAKTTSKWGMYGLIRHVTNDCPYSSTATYGSPIVTGIWN